MAIRRRRGGDVSRNGGSNVGGQEVLSKRATRMVSGPQVGRRAVFAFVLVLAVFAIIAFGIGCYRYHLIEAQRAVENAEHEDLKRLVKVVNDAWPNVRWKARYNPFGVKVYDYGHTTLRNVTAVKQQFDQIEEFFQSKAMAQHLKEIEEFPSTTLPRHFDAREKWAFCPTIHQVPNQGGCGSCYAVAAMTVAADRSCIQSNGTFTSQLSAEDVLGCCQVCGNCYGGDPLKALTYWALEGVVTGGRDGCRPYSVSIECGTPCLPSEYGNAEAKRKCVKKCQNAYYRNKYEEDKHTGSISYTIFPRKMTLDQAGKEKALVSSVIGHFNKSRALGVSEQRDIIRKELFLYGPTTIAFPVTEEFLHYESGIFHPYPAENFEKRIIYWHVTRLIGWGHDAKNQLYWIAVNSFGSEWGEGGTFRIDPTMIEKFGLEYEAGLL